MRDTQEKTEPVSSVFFFVRAVGDAGPYRDMREFPVQSSYVLAGHAGPAAFNRSTPSNRRRG